MPFAEIKIKGHPKPGGIKICGKPPVDNNTDKFNLALGGSFTCGVCGSRHKLADNIPAKRCMNKLWKTELIPTRIRPDRPNDRYFSRKYPGLFYVLHHSSSPGRDDSVMIHARSIYLDWIDCDDYAHIFSSIYKYKKQLVLLSKKNTYHDSYCFDGIFPESVIKPVLLYKTVSERNESIIKICDESMAEKSKTFHGEITGLLDYIRKKTSKILISIPIQKGKTLDPSSACRIKTTYFIGRQEIDLERCIHRAPDIAESEALWSQEEQALYFTAHIESGEYSVLLKATAWERYHEFILSYKTPIKEAVKEYGGRMVRKKLPFYQSEPHVP